MNSKPFFVLIIMKAGRPSFRGRACRYLLLSVLTVSMVLLQSARVAMCLCWFGSSSMAESRAQTCCCAECRLHGVQPGEERITNERLQTAQQPLAGLFATVTGEAAKASTASTENCQVVQRTGNLAIRPFLSIRSLVPEDPAPTSPARPCHQVSAIKWRPLLLPGRSSPIYLATSALLI